MLAILKHLYIIVRCVRAHFLVHEDFEKLKTPPSQRAGLENIPFGVQFGKKNEEAICGPKCSLLMGRTHRMYKTTQNNYDPLRCYKLKLIKRSDEMLDWPCMFNCLWRISHILHLINLMMDFTFLRV